MLCLTGHEVIEAECVNGIETDMKLLPVSAREQAMTDILQSLSELNMVNPGQTFQVRMTND